MTETWGDETGAPKPKGGLPRWFWWTCGIGCAAALLIGIVAVVGAWMMARRGTDPEVMIPKMQKYLPSDPWPAEYEVAFGFELFGTGNYTIQWPGGTAQLQPMPGKRDLDRQMTAGTMENLALSDEVEGEMEVKGRTVRTLAFRQGGLHGLRADLTGEVPPYFMVTLLQHEPPGAEDLDRFLEPFDVWRGED